MPNGIEADSEVPPDAATDKMVPVKRAVRQTVRKSSHLLRIGKPHVSGSPILWETHNNREVDERAYSKWNTGTSKSSVQSGFVIESSITAN